MLSKSHSASHVRQNFFKVLDEVTNDRSILLVERRDAPDVAIISADELKSMMESLHLLRSPNNAKRLFDGLEWSQAQDQNPPGAETAENAIAQLRAEIEQA
jgi:antitoxin YefM